jgi:Na+/proline symporter
MLGLHTADILVLGLYLVGITAIGVWAAKRIKNISDFFMPRRFGKTMMVTHAFGTGTHSDQAVSVASKSYTNGLSGIWYQWLWLFATPFYWLIAPVMRRFRAITTADVFEARYSPSVAMLFAVVGMLNLAINIGVMLKGSSKVVEASTGGLVASNLAIMVMTVLFVIYGIAGGLSAAIITDFIQGILTVVFSFVLLPFILKATGGIDGIREAIKDPEMLSLVAPEEISFFYIVVIAFNGLVGIVTQPHTMGNCAAGRTEMEGRFGWMFGNFIKRICTVAWCLTGLGAIVYFAGREVDPDRIFGLVAAEFLPRILPGVLGLFLAALLASVMSSCDSFMIASSGLFTENIYKRLVPGRSQRHYVTAARLTSLGVVAGGVGFALWLPSVVKGLEIFWMISPMMGIAFWLGLFWRRTTVAGAWASTLTALTIWFLTTLAPIVWLVGHAPYAKQARLVFVKEKTPSPLLRDCEIKDADGLAGKLRDSNDPLSTHIRQKLSEDTKKLLSQYEVPDAVSKELRAKVVGDLNVLMTKGKLGGTAEKSDNRQEDDVFYEESRFARVALTAKTRELISRKPEGKVLVRLNRRLLEEAYGDEILRSWLFCASDIKEPAALAKRLSQADPADPLALYVRERLSDQARSLVASPESVEPDELRATLAVELNGIAGGENIYEENRFAMAFTKRGTIKKSQEDLSGEDLVRLNTYLLEEAFIWEVSKNRKIEIYLPWQMIFYLAAGLVVGITVSLFTKPVTKEKLDNFYALVRTPVTPGEQVEAPCTLPAGAVVPEARRLFPKSSLEIQIPSRTSIIGFAAGWACVAAIIYSVYRIAGS